MILKPLSIFFLVLLVGCSLEGERHDKKQKSKKFTGVQKTHYSDGKLLSEVSFVDGRRNGVAKDYYRDGKVHILINYRNNLKDGLTRMYYQNGQLFEETNYKQGEMHGAQRRWRENGKLSSEANYFKGEPCTGLKEYLLDGSPKKNYPQIVVTTVDQTLLYDTYILKLSMSDKAKDVKFYIGKLDSACISIEKLDMARQTPVKGVSEIEFDVPRGGFIMQELNIIAKVKTVQDNYYVTQRKFNLAIENR